MKGVRNIFTDGTNNILGDMTAIGAAIAPNRSQARADNVTPPTPEAIKKQLEYCKALLATSGRGNPTPETVAKTNACVEYIKKYDPEYVANALKSQIEQCLINVATVKYSPAGDGTTLDPDWEKQRQFCREFLTRNGVAIPDEGGEGGGGGGTQGSVTGLALAIMFDQFPIYISLPVIAYTLFHYRKVWTQYIPFINNK